MPFAGSVRTMADSKSLLGGIVESMIACLFGLSTQLSLDSSSVLPLYSSRVGFASVPAKNCDNDGPIARMITFFGCVPVTMKPPMRTLSPVSTRNRVEILPSTVFGVAVGVALGVAVAVAVGLGVGVGVGVGVGAAAPNSNAPISLMPTRPKPR